MNADAQVKQTSKTPPAVASDAMLQEQQQSVTFGSVNVQTRGSLARIAVSGRFDFHLSRNFRDSYMPLLDNAAIREVHVELSKASYLDSSALGMLLLLNERAKAANKPVTLLTGSGMAPRALEVANFSKTFNIRHIKAQNFGSTGLVSISINSSPIAS